MKNRIFILTAVCLLLFTVANAQDPNRDKLVETLEKDGCVSLERSKVKVCKYEYSANGATIEAISFQPLGKEKSPGIVMIPGYQRTAKDYLSLGTILTGQGFACLAITQPGFGKSQGKPDYVGENTIKVLIAGFEKFQREPYVDAEKMGVYGYSRGGMAASLMTIKLGKKVKAAVFSAGIYDFKKAYDEIKIEGIRENMRNESGMTKAAIKERSSILQMKKLKSPVLILHGEKDENVPVSQAVDLKNRLTELKKDFEIKLYPEEKHSLPVKDFYPIVIDFFSRKLKGEPAKDLKLF